MAVDGWKHCTPDGRPPVDGVEYRISHRRKGAFTGVVLRSDEVWATLQITEGCSHAVTDYNIRLTGEEVCVRNVHCTMLPVVASGSAR